MAYTRYGILGLLTAFVALVYQPVYQRAVVLGFLRPKTGFPNLHGLQALKLLPDTHQCEDMHYHEPSKLIYTACQEDEAKRYAWFPPMAIFTDPTALDRGSLKAIDPLTQRVRTLKLNGFARPLVAHGIDILEAPDDPATLYIFAINHLPNPAHYEARASPDKARSQVEVFRHRVGSSEATFVRAVRHPLIATPNDLLATSPASFYVTNDHFYRDGAPRQLEDALNQQTAPWSSTVHVAFDPALDAAAGVAATTALTGLHNNNGLARAGPHRPHDVLVCDASGGVLTRARGGGAASPALTVLEQIQMDSTLDNPSWFEDRFATPGSNASGYVLAGLARGCDLGAAVHDPAAPIPGIVWHVRADARAADEAHARWEKRVVFQDDGFALRSATTALIVGIDPKSNGGRKQGWLVVTGFVSKGVGITKIDL